MFKSNQFTKALNKLDVKIRTASNQSADVRMFYELGMIEEACDKAFDLEETMEQAVLLSRSLPAYTGSPQARQEVEARMKSNVPIRIGFTKEGWFTVEIPLLLPKKSAGSADYIRAVLYPAMRDFFVSRPPVKYEDCVLIYRHVYDKQRPERQKRDHDNIETNMVSDIVAMYVMPDDGPRVCSNYACSASGTVERTEVFVVPQSEFKSWLDAEGSIQDKGVFLYENVPETE